MSEPAGQVVAARVRVEDLHAFCVRILCKVGVRELDADTAANVLVLTDSWGVFTHGVKSLPGYVRRIRAGGIRAGGRPQVVAEGPAWGLVDGDSALGMVTSTLAMRLALRKAEAAGIGYVGVRNSCHFGAAGAYAALAAEAGMIGLAMANDTPSVSAPGARGRITGSNPLAYAIPTGAGKPILLDMATSTVAGGKVAAAHALGKSIPEGWVIDTDGLPTTDPGAFLRGGALTPMAGHKGYGLALLIEALSGVLTGAAIANQVVSWTVGDPALATGHGAAFLAIDIKALMPATAFGQRIDALVREIQQAPRAAGSEHIYLPGEMEWQRREKALAEGIVLPEDVIKVVRLLAEELRIALPTSPP